MTVTARPRRRASACSRSAARCTPRWSRSARPSSRTSRCRAARCPPCSTRSRGSSATTASSIPTVAHAGDGNLHPNFIFDPRSRRPGRQVPDVIWDAADDLFRAAIRLGGTLTGEHGIGVLKSRWLADELGDDQWELQRQIARVFDPPGSSTPARSSRRRADQRPMPDIHVSAVDGDHDRTGRVLVVRKQGTERFMQPGGKPEAGEIGRADPRQGAARGARPATSRRTRCARSGRDRLRRRERARPRGSSRRRSPPTADPATCRCRPNSPSCAGSRPAGRARACRWPRSARSTCSRSPGRSRVPEPVEGRSTTPR